MFTRLTARALTLSACVFLPLAAAPISQAASAPATVTPHATVRTVYYEDNRAGTWKTDVATATAIWNSSVNDVRFVKATSAHPATVHLIATSGWPQTMSSRPGSGTVDLGQEAVSEGYSPPRIAAHELGHILGLPDNYNGDCGALMSGHSAGTACTNDHPDAAEIAAVQRIFSRGLAPYALVRIYSDGAAAPSVRVRD